MLPGKVFPPHYMQGFCWLYNWLQSNIRVYTLQFAREIVDLYQELVSSPHGQPALPQPVPPAIESFESLPNEVGLGYAGLDSVFNYLRRNTSLRIPFEWKGHIPGPTIPLAESMG